MQLFHPESPYFKTYVFLTTKTLQVMPPFEEEGVYCFANVDWSVGMSVDQMVSTDYLENHISECLHISHVDWL